MTTTTTFCIESTDAHGSTLRHHGLTAAQTVTLAEALENAGDAVRVFVGTTDRRISTLTVCRLALGESIDWWLRASA